MNQIIIQGGRVIDPASPAGSGSSGDSVTDLRIEGDRIVDAFSTGSGSPIPGSSGGPRVIDASGHVVMAGGIDLHTHIGGGKVSLARLLLAEMPDRDEFLPTASVTADRYLDMGYTTCFEPAVIPCNARSAHAEMADVAGIDTGGYCLLGNDEVLLRMIAEKCPGPLINDYVAWMVRATQCIAVKVVNPGGISAFKDGSRTFDLDTPHPTHGVTPAKVIEVLCRSVHEIGLAHPLHVHCTNLGVPGNIDTTLATIRAADGLPIHLTHAQFHAYGKGTEDNESAMVSAASQLADAMGRYPNVTMDVGQIMFGQTVTISADTMHQHENFRYANPRKSVLVDVECEAGCGVVPFRYRRRQFVHSLQWAIGLELFLMVDDPSRVFLTTDHPNGAPFTTYPHLIRLLGDRSFRETALAEINSEAKSSCNLSGIDREYSLRDIATMTRSAPAKLLGLSDRGHLGAGALADVVVYREDKNLEKMFAEPAYVIRRGQVVRDAQAARKLPGESPGESPGKSTGESTGESIRDNPSKLTPWTLKAEVEFDPASITQLAKRYESNSTFAMKRLWIDDDEMLNVLGTQPIAADVRGRSR